MESPPAVRRVVLVILDGLRADAVPLFQLPILAAVARCGTATFAATTVRPSITSAAMTSLFTGVSPRVHGVDRDGFCVPRLRDPSLLLTRILRRHGRPVRIFLRGVPRAYRGLVERMAGYLDADVHTGGDDAEEILDAALPSVRAGAPGVEFIHWPDADNAGHRHGWMSSQYADAARRLDRALGRLIEASGILTDPHSVLIALADHGGGGRVARNHESSHPLDTTIPIVFAGGPVSTGELAPMTSLLDIPATITWIFGIQQPASYPGRPLIEAFADSTPAAVASSGRF